MMMVHCAGCDRPIQDRFLLNVLDCAWHASCVQCSDCKSSLTEKCFSRDGKLYCREDFFRRFGTKCAGCSTGISPSDLVRKAKDKVFHLKCFTCMVCRKQLSTGEELYVLDENKFVCKYDFINSKLSGSDSEEEGDFDTIPENCDNISEKDYSLNGDDSPDTKDTFLPELINNKMSNFDNSTGISVLDIKKEPTDIESAHIENSDILNNNPGSVGTDGASIKSPVTDIDQTDNLNVANSNHSSEAEIPDEDSVSNGNSNSGSKRRGPRTTIKAKQLETLKSAFNATPKPTRHIREQLAKETGLNMRVIQVWFQNRRSKERRMKQLSALGARRHFFRNPRRMRGPGMSPDDSPDMMGPPGFGYFPEDNPDFCGYQGFNDFFPGQDGHAGMGYFTPPPGHHPMHMEQPILGMGNMGANPEEQFIPHEMNHHPSGTPPMPADMAYNSDRLALSQSLAHHHPDLISKAW